MDKRHYFDFFAVDEKYSANMTRDNINEYEDKWLDFYPHEKYVEFFSTLFDVIRGEDKSIWLTGNLGTGKSHAALVTQKLFSDDEERIKKWFEKYKKVLANSPNLYSQLSVRRNETLVVYDYNASGIGPNAEFLVRLEKGIAEELKSRKMLIPPSANLDEIIKRVRREEYNFFLMRDKIQSELSDLKPEIKTVDQLVSLLQSEKAKGVPSNLLGDVQKVLRSDNIYLDISVTSFKKWIKDILSANKLKSIVYVFDEFASFINANSDQLKTFEDVTESPRLNRFFLIPVTHMSISAYMSDGSQNAKKANERFYFRRLQMPNDTAFRLAATAIKCYDKDPEIAAEWERERSMLWGDVRSIAEDYFKEDDVKKESFLNLLPIHPMAAYLLKFLAESAQSDQRSIFEYLKGSANGREFQDFIKNGGPAIKSKQFLTVDYLWRYFIERDDLGINKGITFIRNEFERIKNREFRGRDLDDPDIRVLKTALLFCLLSRLQPDGHERLRPTVQNIELSFQGDGAIVNVFGILKELERKQCFNIVNNNIELFTSSIGGQDVYAKVDEFINKFDDLLSPKCKKTIEDRLGKAFSSFSSGRFDIRVSDVTKVTLGNFDSAIRENYGKGREKDNGSVYLWFVIAKNKNEQMQIPDKIKSILSQLYDYRVLMLTFPETSFCDNDAEQWNEYVREYAQWTLENDGEAKNRRKKAFEQIENILLGKIKQFDTTIKVYSYKNGQVFENKASWEMMKDLLGKYVREQLESCPDFLAFKPNVFDTKGLKSWATTGLTLIPALPEHDAFVKGLKEQGISESIEWFKQNPDHPFAQIRIAIDKKIKKTVDKGANLSIKQVYRELQRAPYGLKHNALTAFALGFALRFLLESNYMCTYGQRTDPLDKQNLAFIIEDAIKSDSGKGSQEKLICRISDDERAFIEKAPQIFGFANANGEDSVEKTILNIQNRLERDFGRVPLWIFAEYVENINEPMAKQIIEIIGKICRAGSMSAKNNIEERANYIKEIGKSLHEDESLVAHVAKYVRPDNAQVAFWEYIDRIALPLKKLAEESGDFSHGYCDVLLSKMRETSSFLWNKADIGREIEDTIREYEVIKLTKPIIGTSDFIAYESVIDNLLTAVERTNKLPKSY